MKPEFFEDYVSKDADTIDAQLIDFDWDDLAARLGETKEELPGRDYESLLVAFRRLFDWLLATDLQRPGCERFIGRRVIALAWAMNPGIFEGSPSLTKLAEQIGVHKATLSNYTSDASRTFGVRNRAQAHGWNWKMERQAATTECPPKGQTFADIAGIKPLVQNVSDAKN